MLRYSVLIQYDSVDNIYVAKIPELQGCMAHDETQEDAMREIKIAGNVLISLSKYADTCREQISHARCKLLWL